MSKKAIFIIAQNDFQDKELAESKGVLSGRGIEIKIAARTKDKAIGKLGGEVTPDLALDEVKVKDFSAVIFIGGPGAVDYFVDPIIWKLVQDFKKFNKIIAAICIAPSILANAGVLISKTATAFPSEEENLKNKGADYTGMQVEVDGKIITGKDPSAAREFGEKIAYLLEE